jgi:hypothetical protein
MAQNLFDFSTFWQIYNETDDVYTTALSIISDRSKYRELKVSD